MQRPSRLHRRRNLAGRVRSAAAAGGRAACCARCAPRSARLPGSGLEAAQDLGLLLRGLEAAVAELAARMERGGEGREAGRLAQRRVGSAAAARRRALIGGRADGQPAGHLMIQPQFIAAAVNAYKAQGREATQRRAVYGRIRHPHAIPAVRSSPRSVDKLKLNVLQGLAAGLGEQALAQGDDAALDAGARALDHHIVLLRGGRRGWGAVLERARLPTASLTFCPLIASADTLKQCLHRRYRLCKVPCNPVHHYKWRQAPKNKAGRTLTTP